MCVTHVEEFLAINQERASFEEEEGTRSTSVAAAAGLNDLRENI